MQTALSGLPGYRTGCGSDGTGFSFILGRCGYLNSGCCWARVMEGIGGRGGEAEKRCEGVVIVS